MRGDGDGPAADRSTSPEAAKISIDRLTFFSDAVVAIAMTLLAIDLPVPTVQTAHEMLEFFRQSGTEYLAFLLSFVVIFTYWRDHHRIYRYVTDAPRQLIRTSSIWLLAIVLTPYATRLLYSGESVRDGDFPIRFAFYAAVQALAAVAFVLSNRAIQRLDILSPEAPRGLMAYSQMRGVVILATFLASIPVAFLAHASVSLVWALFPIWMRLGTRVLHRRHPELSDVTR